MSPRLRPYFSPAYILSVLALVGCAGHILQYEKADQVLKNDEYEKKVQVKQIEPPALLLLTNLPVEAAAPTEKKMKKKAKVEPKKVVKKGKEKVTNLGVHLPELENSDGFVGRRPIKDPFRVGEKISLSLTYFNITAGTMDLMVKPMVEVNGEKAYHFEVHAESYSLFSRIYAVDDTAVTYMKYDDMVPLSLSITLKESKQLAETRTFFDWNTMKANYWQKRVTQEHGEESKKLEWDIKPFTQNVISAAYYMRVFNWENGKKYEFRVADEGKNLVFGGEVVRREVIKTELGEMKTVVIKPSITVDGAFQPMGEIFVWLTDDDRKFIVRIESKIKIGTLIAKIKSLDKGQD